MNTNPNAKVVVCYGDSNTWGAVPLEGDRYPANVRWVGVLQDILGNDYEVINEGLCGRTFVAEDSDKPYRAGITHLKSILSTNDPIHFLVILLGTNDLKSTYHLTAEQIADHLRETIQLVKRESIDENVKAPKMLVICPTAVANPRQGELDHRYKNSLEMSRELPGLYQQVAKEEGCAYINAGEFISLEDTDGYHFTAKDHKLLGEKVAGMIKEMDK